MRSGYFTKALLGCLLCLSIAVTSGCINIGNWPRAKYERTVQLSAPFSAGSTFTAQTHNGAITINGADVAVCSLTATIVAQAQTKEGAKRLADETKIKLVPFGDKMTVKIEKPTFKRNQSISVGFDAKVPNRTSLELTTHNGAVRITNVAGKVNGTTHNGKIVASQVSGNIKLQTHNGGVICKQISGDTQIGTHNGSIKAFYSETALSVCDVSLITHNGNIDFMAPPNFSAAVEVSTHNGSIKTELPIMLIGEMSKKKLTGTIGSGQGGLRLATHNGSIKIK